jgi:phage-related protein
MATKLQIRTVVWVGSSRKEFAEFPEPVKDRLGYALYVAQRGGKHDDARPLKGYNGAGVVEIARDYRGDTFRAVYTVRFASAVYVLHAFQKKSKTGRETPKSELALVDARLREAERIEKERTT